MNEKTETPRLDAIVHTPGPWYRDGYKDDVCRSVIVRDATGFEVALTRHWGVQEREANANLIAAAPEMFAALKHLIAASAGVRCQADSDTAMLFEAMRPAVEVLDKLEVV